MYFKSWDPTVAVPPSRVLGGSGRAIAPACYAPSIYIKATEPSRASSSPRRSTDFLSYSWSYRGDAPSKLQRSTQLPLSN